MNRDEYGMEDELYKLLGAKRLNSAHPERYVLGKPHPDRAKQFKPFAALRGYEELVDKAVSDAADLKDFFDIEEPC